MSLLLNGSPLPADISEPGFPCSASVGRTEVPFQGRGGTIPNPYTAVHPQRPRARIIQRARARGA